MINVEDGSGVDGQASPALRTNQRIVRKGLLRVQRNRWIHASSIRFESSLARRPVHWIRFLSILHGCDWIGPLLSIARYHPNDGWTPSRHPHPRGFHVPRIRWTWDRFPSPVFLGWMEIWMWWTLRTFLGVSLRHDRSATRDDGCRPRKRDLPLLFPLDGKPFFRGGSCWICLGTRERDGRKESSWSRIRAIILRGNELVRVDRIHPSFNFVLLASPRCDEISPNEKRVLLCERFTGPPFEAMTRTGQSPSAIVRKTNRRPRAIGVL